MKSCPNCGELLGSSVKKCFNCSYNYDLGRVEYSDGATRAAQEAARAAQEAAIIAAQNEQIRKNARYEYETVAIDDLSDGRIDGRRLQSTLLDFAGEGWKLHSVIQNEIGKIGSKSTIGGVTAGINATIEQIILIFERCIKAEGPTV